MIPSHSNTVQILWCVPFWCVLLFSGGCSVQSPEATLPVTALHYSTPGFSVLREPARIALATDFAKPIKQLPYRVLVMVPKEKEESIQYNFYADRIAFYVVKSGLKPLEGAAIADYIVTFTYGIDKGVKRIVTEPITGVVGTASTFAHANVNGYGDSASVNGFSYNIPQYGIVGTDTHSVTDYTKFFIMAMFNRRTGKQIMEAKAVNVGGIGNFAEVGECLIRGAFAHAFGGPNGAVRHLNVPLPCGDERER